MAALIAVVLAWVIINLMVASLIRRNDETRFLQNMRIAMLWVAPFIGVLFSLGATAKRKEVNLAEQPILPGTIVDEAPLKLMLAGAGQLNVQDHTYISGDFPVLDWNAVQEWADKGPQGYTSGYQQDGGHVAGSSGMFIHAGCPHFVVPAAGLHQIEPVIAHELTHSALAHLCLPRWLDEGLAVNTEIRLTGSGINATPQKELRERHLAFWGESEIQEFWTGASFFRPDDGNELSYELARILVAYLGKQWDSFSTFAKASQRSDGGAAAAQAALGVSLGTLACGLLEQEYSSSWEPAPLICN